ncbi:MAG TPA: acyltransferase [Dongiaceae bacterium]|nr:acyltransferase [Dongiaceae bacterium]
MDYLDGVRGWAALIVVLHHLALTFKPVWLKTGEVTPKLGPFSFLVDGGLAVSVFFILSGIVLAAATDGALRRLGGPTLVGLVAKRWLRLMLPILTVALFAWALLRANFNLAPMAAMFTGSTWATGLFPRWYDPTLPRVLWEAVYGAFAGPETPFHNPVLWTMRVEFPGSILTFAICLLARSARTRLIVCALAALALLQTPFWILNECALFPVGIMMWEVLKKREEPMMGRIPDLCGLALAAFGLVVLPVLDHLSGTVSLRQDMTKVADDMGLMNLDPGAWRAALIIGGICLSPTAMRFLGNSLSRFLGRISFAIYLSHSLVLASLGALTFILLQRPLGHTGSMAAATFGVLAISITLGWGLHHWVERPAIAVAGRAGAVVDRMWRRMATV